MKKFAFVVIYCLLFNVLCGQPLVTFDTLISSGLNIPVDVVNAKDGSNRLFIVEKAGTIKIWNGTGLLDTPFLNVTDRIVSDGERGLLSLAFHPNYLTNRYFFVFYNDTTGSILIRRYQTKASNFNQADTSTGVTLFTISKLSPNHNGGKLLFGNDGYLYFATGDGGGAGDPDNNAQNGSSLLGKMIRVDVNGSVNSAPYYTIPPTNPFMNNTAFHPAIIGTGLRNPWRYSLDRRTGNLWLADVGQAKWEEVNVVSPGSILGANYGWSCLEGTDTFKTDCNANPGFNNSIHPIFQYSHNDTTGGYSITGGLVYRGLEFPALQGYYLTVDFSTGLGWLIKPNTSSAGYDITLQRWKPLITSFGESEDSTMYATSLNGILYKVRASSALPLHLSNFNAAITNNFHEITWKVVNEEESDLYVIEKRSTTNEPFTEVFRTTSVSSRNSNSYKIKLEASSPENFYRLKIISKNGQIQYSSIIRIANNNGVNFRAFVSGKNLYTNLPADAKSISLFNTDGKLIVKQTVTGGNGFTTIPLQSLPRGIIIVKVQLKNEVLVRKVVY